MVTTPTSPRPTAPTNRTELEARRNRLNKVVTTNPEFLANVRKLRPGVMTSLSATVAGQAQEVIEKITSDLDRVDALVKSIVLAAVETRRLGLIERALELGLSSKLLKQFRSDDRALLKRPAVHHSLIQLTDLLDRLEVVLNKLAGALDHHERVTQQALSDPHNMWRETPELAVAR